MTPFDLKPGDAAELEIAGPAFRPVLDYIRARAKKPYWTKRTAELLKKPEDPKRWPVFWCCKCRRFEDGAHRVDVAMARGRSTIAVRAHSACYNPKALHEQIGALLRADPGIKLADIEWVEACHEKKWIHLEREIDYRAKRILDVGSQAGYICLAARAKGAASAIGIEKRSQLVGFSRQAARILTQEDGATFFCEDWFDTGHGYHRLFDVVHCLGVPHYFPAGRYGEAIGWLADAARERLALEMRLSPRTEDALTTKGSQTLPTKPWLARTLRGFNFEPEKTFPISGDFRELWIARRTK